MWNGRYTGEKKKGYEIYCWNLITFNVLGESLAGKGEFLFYYLLIYFAQQT